ncbi:MAP kinase kinase kinase [Aureococcus anophagefferens]|nr:MAP kinase kinase kinase [Aureococcus anophagefferens]
MASFQEDDDVCEIGTVNATKPSNPYRRGGASPSPSGSEGSPRSSSRSTNPYARSASSPSSTRSEELAAVSQSQAVSPHRAGQYRKGEAIGRGANGTVYQGMCLVTGKLVAIKEVQVPRGDSSFAKLRTEVQLMAKLSHANIVEYLGAELDEGAGLLSIYQEWVPGGSIDSLLAKFGGTFADSITKRYAEETLKGLAYLHEHRIVHRDIKGGNVLVTEGGRAKLADFGTSMMMAGETAGDGGAETLCGTPYFMAPEVMKGDTYGRKSDVWSVGGLLLQMAGGEPPWKCLKFHSIPQLLLHVVSAQGPPPLGSYALSPDVEDLILSCFKYDPAARPTALALLDHAFFRDGSAPAAPAKADSPPKKANPYARSPRTQRVAANPYAPDAEAAAFATLVSSLGDSDDDDDDDDNYDDTFESETPSANDDATVPYGAPPPPTRAETPPPEEESDDDENLMTIEDAHVQGLLSAADYQLRLSRIAVDPTSAFYRAAPP